MRVDSRAEVRVTLHAVRLLVARRAARQILSRRAAVLEKPERLRIVEDRAARVRLRGEPGLSMTAAAKRLGRMTAAAIDVSPVCLRCVRREKVRGMIAACDPFPHMAIGAEALRMTARALELPGRRDHAVRLQKT